MLNLNQEKILAKVISTGIAFTTIFVVSGTVTDPVNVTKFLTLGITAFAALGVLITNRKIHFHRGSSILLIILSLFVVSGILSVAMSKSPISQGIYGVYGRNNGLSTYIFLSIILFATSRFLRISSFTLLIRALLFAGIVNVAYCLWAIMFGDFIGWSNPYGNILGTFGNPNFIGSFLGIFIAAYLGYALKESVNKWLKYSILVVIPVTAFEIYNSHAIQGRVVGASGLGVITFFYIRSRFSKIVTWCYSIVVATTGLFALFGALQIGPLTQYIYKTSVSLRGQYWLAGWNTGIENPVHGAGMDAFGDWYRRARDSHALELPGVNTIVNASHNVPLDIFAFGGWPLFISYLLIMGYGGWALVQSTIRSKTFDPILAVLASSWVGYQLQSIISINQIGLAIWGWALTGAAIAYERASRDKAFQEAGINTTNRATSRKVEQDPRVMLYSTVFAFMGLIVALPPFTSDSQWRSAQLSQSVQPIESSMSESYFNPPNSFKYLNNIQVLEQNQLFDLAHKYAIDATKWNPEAFELWKVLYLIKNSTPSEKADALKNMQRLDPLNPDVTSIK